VKEWEAYFREEERNGHLVGGEKEDFNVHVEEIEGHFI
jgi:hypothetical protein